jgi:hypothetical protein
MLPDYVVAVSHESKCSRVLSYIYIYSSPDYVVGVSLADEHQVRLVAPPV